MVLGAFLEPLGFIASLIQIANALGFNTPAQQAQWKSIENEIGECREVVKQKTKQVEKSINDIKKQVRESSVIEIRSRLPSDTVVPADKIDLLISLLFYIKTRAPNAVFAIMVKYMVGSQAATLGFCGKSAEAIEHMFREVDRFYRGLSVVNAPKTSYISVRIRGKFDVTVENFCLAALTNLAMQVCALKGEVKLRNRDECVIEPEGEGIGVLMCPKKENCAENRYDRLSRVFVIGDTRTGKSTLGNAILARKPFKVSKGITGTMKVERDERRDLRDSTMWKTEVYDTPGLNDKDGLDEFYLTAIEDEIRTLQRASTLIMTIRVDDGIKKSSFESLTTYRELFGESIVKMLLIVLTINDPKHETSLDSIKHLNWPTIVGMQKEIVKANVFCVNLYDLRERGESDSHSEVKEIGVRCRSMEMKLIESVERKYRKLRDSLQKKSSALHNELRRLMHDGWMTYDRLCSDWSTCSYVKVMFEDNSGTKDAFMMKHASLKDRLLGAVTLGLENRIRKGVIFVGMEGQQAKEEWLKMKSAGRQKGDGRAMKDFAEIVRRQQLAVYVEDMGTHRKLTHTVHIYKLTVFNPVSREHGALMSHLNTIISSHRHEYRDDVVNELLKSAMKMSFDDEQSSGSKRTSGKSRCSRK